MVRFMKIAALAGGTLVVSALPVFAQDLNALNPLGLDLDPFHLFTPAPPAPAAGPVVVVVHHHHHHHHHGHHHGHPHHKAK